MKIVYFNANLRIGQDGVTRVIYKMIDGALERDHQVIAIASTLPETFQQYVPMYKVPSVVLPLQKAYRIAFPGYMTFASILKEFQPDILHINSPCTLGFAAVKYAKQFSLPVVATYHTHFPTYPRYYGLKRFEDFTWRVTRTLYNQVDCTFVPTKPILEELREHNIERLVYLPNGVDTTLFNPGRRSIEWRKQFVGSSEKPIVLFVSRLVWEKNLRVLATAYNILRSKNLEFEMVIVGDGHARDEFQKMMPAAHFLGHQWSDSLARSFASSDIFVFPSTTETFGLVTLEAMASGLVPVAAKAGGAIELIEDNVSGLLTKPHDGEDFASRIEYLLRNPSYAKQIATRAFQRPQQYSWNTILTQLFSMYEQIIERKRHHTVTMKAA